MSGWGSSSAQGNGGRVRTPAPTMYPKVYLSLRRARCPQRADSGRPGVPPLTSAACGRTVCAPTEKKKKRAVNDLWERESPAASRHPPLTRGAFFRSKSCLSREHPHPPPSGAPSPLKGEGLRAATWGRPYGRRQSRDVGSANSGADLEPHQEQILQTQGPVARREVRHPLKFCAPETMHTLSGVRPP